LGFSFGGLDLSEVDFLLYFGLMLLEMPMVMADAGRLFGVLFFFVALLCFAI
jgi:hypothetical protein